MSEHCKIYRNHHCRCPCISKDVHIYPRREIAHGVYDGFEGEAVKIGWDWNRVLIGHDKGKVYCKACGHVQDNLPPGNSD